MQTNAEKTDRQIESAQKQLETTQKYLESHIQSTRQGIQTLVELHREGEERAKRVGQTMARMMDAVIRLSHIAASHEERLSDLEDEE